MGLVEAILERLFPPQIEPLASATRGRRVMARGRVLGRDLIESPLAGRRCVYYHSIVETWSRSTGTWLVVERDEAIAEFYLQDDTARAVIAPQHALVEVPPSRAEVRDLDSGRRARELFIGPGDVVEVHGVLADVEDLLDDYRGYREEPVKLLIRAAEGAALRIRLVEEG